MCSFISMKPIYRWLSFKRPSERFKSSYFRSIRFQNTCKFMYLKYSYINYHYMKEVDGLFIFFFFSLFFMCLCHSDSFFFHFNFLLAAICSIKTLITLGPVKMKLNIFFKKSLIFPDCIKARTHTHTEEEKKNTK